MCTDSDRQNERRHEFAEFPPYTYDRNRERRPRVDSPAGRRAVEDYEPQPLEPDNWRRCGVYLFAIDLFNRGWYWEAHEEWEALWVLAGRQGVTADFLKGLIKLAAAGVKCRESRVNGVARHTARAVELLEMVRSASRRDEYAGLSLPSLIHSGRALQSRAEAGELPGDPQAEIIFPFRLQPDS